jgi:hypothetical protein
VLNAGEECDDGVKNGTPDSRCNLNCSVKPGSECRGKRGEQSLCYRDVRVVVQEEEILKKKMKLQ